MCSDFRPDEVIWPVSLLALDCRMAEHPKNARAALLLLPLVRLDGGGGLFGRGSGV